MNILTILLQTHLCLTTDEEWKAFEEEAPKEIEATVERILDAVALSQRNKEVVYARYKDKMTLAKIGKKFGCSTATARNTIIKMQIRFRIFYFGEYIPDTYPYNLLGALYPSNEWVQTFIKVDPKEIVEMVEFLIEDFPEKDKQVFCSFYRDGMPYAIISKEFEISQGRITRIIGSCLAELRKNMFPPKKDETLVAEDMEKMSSILLDDDIKKIIAGIRISELELDTRSLNCMRRARLNTIADIVVYDYENNGDWSKIRNMGPKSLDVLKRAVKEYGIDIG